MPSLENQSLIKWAGGKTRQCRPILEILLACLREQKIRRYIEPFLGGGSIYSSVAPYVSAACVSDSNRGLISFYKWLAHDPDKLYDKIQYYACRMNEKEYYRLRTQYNRIGDGFQRAVFFYVLNRYSYNGVYRVNRNGEFNVPYNYQRRTALPSKKSFREHSALYAKAEIFQGDYREILRQAKSGDVVYLDPPYPALNNTAFFNHYSLSAFSQYDLAVECCRLDEVGCVWVLSNADTPEMRRMFKKYNKIKVPQTRFVSCKNKKLTVNELIITNQNKEILRGQSS